MGHEIQKLLVLRIGGSVEHCLVNSSSEISAVRAVRSIVGHFGGFESPIRIGLLIFHLLCLDAKGISKEVNDVSAKLAGLRQCCLFSL